MIAVLMGWSKDDDKHSSCLVLRCLVIKEQLFTHVRLRWVRKKRCNSGVEEIDYSLLHL